VKWISVCNILQILVWLLCCQCKRNYAVKLLIVSLCVAQFMFHRPLRVVTTMLLLTSVLVLYQFYVLAQATEWSHILSISILLFSNYYTLFKLMRDWLVLGRAYKDQSSMLWQQACCPQYWPTQRKLGPFGGGLLCQSLTDTGITKQHRKIQNSVQIN